VEPLFCGIDVGTQGARCAVVAADGAPVGRGESAFPRVASSLPDGWFEQDPDDWIAAVRQALGQALKAVDARRILATSVTSTSGTLCALDADHRPLCPAVMYSDSRSEAEAVEAQQAGGPLTARLGYRFSPSFGLPKILWFRRHRPDLYARAASLVSPTDYVIGWLTDSWGRSDQTNVLKFGYDLLEDRWPAFIERELGIEIGLLPNVQRPGELAGRVTPERADQTGLPAGTPVAAGMTDGCASQVSSGAASPGQYNTTIGTTLVIKGVSERLTLDPEGRVYCHRHPAGWWLPGGASNTGAECLAVEFGEKETESLSPRALEGSPTDLIAYPLVGRGERFPFRRPDAEGFLIGAPRSRQELFTAYLEGVACLERLAYDTLASLGAEIGDVVFSAGGGARSEAWLQIRADTLNRTVLRPALTGAAMGAAILAASLAHYDDLARAARAMVRMDREVGPRTDFVGRYAEKYQRFTEECSHCGYV